MAKIIPRQRPKRKSPTPPPSPGAKTRLAKHQKFVKGEEERRLKREAKEAKHEKEVEKKRIKDEEKKQSKEDAKKRTKSNPLGVSQARLDQAKGHCAALLSLIDAIAQDDEEEASPVYSNVLRALTGALTDLEGMTGTTEKPKKGSKPVKKTKGIPKIPDTSDESDSDKDKPKIVRTPGTDLMGAKPKTAATKYKAAGGTKTVGRIKYEDLPRLYTHAQLAEQEAAKKEAAKKGSRKSKSPSPTKKGKKEKAKSSTPEAPKHSRRTRAHYDESLLALDSDGQTATHVATNKKTTTAAPKAAAGGKRKAASEALDSPERKKRVARG